MREDKTKKRVSNKYMHYFLNLNLGSYALEKRADYVKGTDINTIRQEVGLVLEKNQIPIHWIESVMSIVRGEEPTHPDHEYLALKVGNQYIFSSIIDPNMIKQQKGEPLTIEINGQVTKTELKGFISRHSDLIAETTKLLGLPESNYKTGSSFDENILARVGVAMGKSISEVAEFIDPDTPDAGDYSTTKHRIGRAKKTRDT